MTLPLYSDPYYVDIVDDGLPKQIVHKTDHVAEGVARLISQYSDKPRIVRLLAIYLQQFQDIEDAFWGIIDNANIENATGWIQEALGKVLVEKKNGLSEADFRTVLRAKVKVLQSSGKPEELIEIIRRISVDASEESQIVVELFESIGIMVKLVSTLGPINPDVTFRLLRQATAGGIPLQFVFSRDPSTEHFELASINNPVSSTTKGLGSTVNLALGGKLASIRA